MSRKACERGQGGTKLAKEAPTDSLSSSLLMTRKENKFLGTARNLAQELLKVS